MRPFRVSTMCALLLLACASAWAQGTAQISGLVRDESGAVLPGVTVTVTQTDTGFTRTVVTNEDGAYSMPNLVTDLIDWTRNFRASAPSHARASSFRSVRHPS